MTALAMAAGAARVGSSPTPFTPRAVMGRRGLESAVQLEVGQVYGLGKYVVHHASAQGLAGGVVDHALIQGLPDALGYCAVNLAVVEHGVEYLA